MQRLARMADFLIKRVDTGFKTIATHDGSFHCDEALACYLLKLLPELKGAGTSKLHASATPKTPI